MSSKSIVIVIVAFIAVAISVNLIETVLAYHIPRGIVIGFLTSGLYIFICFEQHRTRSIRNEDAARMAPGDTADSDAEADKKRGRSSR